jgi:branched-chain amino acid transport system ATP-binding protein
VNLNRPWTGDVIFRGERLNRPGARGSRKSRNFSYDAVTRRRMNPRAAARADLIHVPEGGLLFLEKRVEETLAVAPVAAHGRGDTRVRMEHVHTLFPASANGCPARSDIFQAGDGR